MSDIFSWVPAYGAQLREAPRTLVAQFGDGYQQRSGDGVYTILQEWMVVFNAPNSIADAIVAFLRTHEGAQAFYWTPPGQSTYISVICSTWQETVFTNARTVNATFQQVPSELDEIWDDGLTVWDLGL